MKTPGFFLPEFLNALLNKSNCSISLPEAHHWLNEFSSDNFKVILWSLINDCLIYKSLQRIVLLQTFKLKPNWTQVFLCQWLFKEAESFSPCGEISVNMVGIYLNKRMGHFHHSTMKWNFSFKGSAFLVCVQFLLDFASPTDCQLSRTREHLDLSGEESLSRETESGQSCIFHSSLNFCSLGCLWPVTIAS